MQDCKVFAVKRIRGKVNRFVPSFKEEKVDEIFIAIADF